VTAESGAVTIVQTPAPGTVIAGGNTTVTFTVSNAHGQVTCQATVRVVVPVAIANVGILSGTPNQIVAQIQTVAGLTYRIQMTAELKADGSTEWTTIGSVTGNGEVIPLAAPIGPGNAFFRIIVE
jgi:PKD repeat protein